MKKLKILSVIFVVTALILSSCGSSKKTIDPYADNKAQTPTKEKIKREECEDKAIEKSEFLRGYGIGTSSDNMFAREQSFLAAQNAISNQVDVAVSGMIERYNQQHSSNSSGELSREDQGRVQGTVRALTDNELKGAKAICTNSYMAGTNYEVHVCLELTNADFLGKVYNKLTNDEKLMIDYESEKFKEDFNEELEKYRQRKAEELNP